MHAEAVQRASRERTTNEHHQDRMTVVVVAVMVVTFWFLLLVAPASSSLSLGTRFGVGALFTALLPALMWLRSRP